MILTNLKQMLQTFEGGFSDEEMTMDTIEDFYDENDYLLDTHTAVAVGVSQAIKEENGDNTKTVIVSTDKSVQIPSRCLQRFDRRICGR